jgi:hypothetical protein
VRAQLLGGVPLLAGSWAARGRWRGTVGRATECGEWRVAGKRAKTYCKGPWARPRRLLRQVAQKSPPA